MEFPQTLLLFMCLMSKSANVVTDEKSNANDFFEELRKNFTAELEKIGDAPIEEYLSDIEEFNQELNGIDNVTGVENNSTFIDGGNVTTTPKPISYLITTENSLSTTTKRSVRHKHKIAMSLQPYDCLGFENLTSVEADDEGDEDMTVYSAEVGSGLNVTCLTRTDHEWESTAPGYRPDEQMKVIISRENQGHSYFEKTVWC